MSTNQFDNANRSRELAEDIGGETYPQPDLQALLQRAASLLEMLDGQIASHEARAEDAAELEREAQTSKHRRAARNERDKACYRIGGALEPTGGHMLDAVAFRGLDHLGGFGVLLLCEVAIRHPRESLSGLMHILFEQPNGALVREWGVWAGAVWTRKLYIAETQTFLLSRLARDPAQRWRTQKPTARQAYLVEQISLFLQLKGPSFETRGSAFEWIKKHGGNPRFLAAPVMPVLPQIGDRP